MNNHVPAIHLTDIWVRFDRQVVLEAVYLDIQAGEIVSIVGPNGSGKTTLLKTILGLKRPFKGELRIFGEPVKPGSPSLAIGYLPQELSVSKEFPVSAFDVVAFSIYGKKSFFSKLNRDNRQTILKALDRVEMADWANTHFGSLSGGQKQRVLIARALAMQSKIMILDEPATGLDVVSQDRFYALLKQFRDEEKMTILMVSHDIGAVSGIVDRIACLNRRIHFHGRPADCIPSEALQRVFGKHVQFVYHSHHCQTCENLK